MGSDDFFFLLFYFDVIFLVAFLFWGFIVLNIHKFTRVSVCHTAYSFLVVQCNSPPFVGGGLQFILIVTSWRFLHEGINECM
jgi:hypothetical protein